MNISRGLPLLAAAVVVFLTAFTRSPAQTAEAPSAADAWPLGDVEITDSPLVTTGQLENGLRYAIRPHTAPDGRLSLRLLVEAGSLHENDDERGFAHFVEHMAFNGTKNFPAGELVKFLQRQGARYGPHINATTSVTSTVYKLDLPAAAPDSLETGLRVFRDFADGILFESGEVRRERGVILSEDHMRRTPENAEVIARDRLLYDGTRIPERALIGLSAQIERTDRSGLRHFYDAWYRPERISVIVVGNVSPAEAKALVEKHFASLSARAPARPEPVVGQSKTLTAPAIAIHARPLAGATTTFYSITDRTEKHSTLAGQLRGFRVRVAISILRERLTRHVDAPSAIINQTTSDMDVDFLKFRRLSLSVASSPENIAPALALLEQELRRAQEQGFTPEEVARQRSILRDALRSTAESVSTVPASGIADAFVKYVEDDSPLRLINDSLDDLLAVLDRLTPENCQSALQEFFAQPPRIFVSCSANHLPSVETVTKAYHASRAIPVVANAPGEAESSFAYEDFGPSGTVAERNEVADLGITQLHLANGVRANLKPTAFEAGQVRILIRLGYGRLAEPPDQPGLALWHPFLWEGGTSKHTAAEFRRFLGGLNGVTTSTLDDANTLEAALPKANLTRGLRQLTALIADPAFRDEGWEPARSILRGYIGPLWNKPEGAVAQFVLPLLAGGDSRIGIPADAKYLARTADQYRAWFTPQLAIGPIELSIVGDFEIEPLIDELTRTVGTLPTRAPREAQTFPVDLNFHRDRRVARYYFKGTAEQASRWEFFWRIREPVTPKERRHIEMLADIFGDRVRAEVRERKGSTYRVAAGVSWNDIYPGFSFIRCSVDHQPAHREKHTRAVRKLALAIAEKGVTADELARAKAQALASLASEQNTNEYWLKDVLADSQQRPFRLEAERTARTDLSSATVADLNALAARYFGPDRVFHYLIVPSALIPKKK